MSTELERSIEREDQEIQEEVTRFGLGRFMMFVLKPGVSASYGAVSHVVLLPVDYADRLLRDRSGSLDLEVLSAGLTEAVAALRPYGPSLMLGVTLVGLSQAQRKRASTEQRLEWITEAVDVFEQKGKARLRGRALLELGTILRDTGYTYDSLAAYDRAETMLSEVGDGPGAAAARYHRAVIARSSELYEEGVLYLDSVTRENPRLTRYEQEGIWAETVACALEIGDKTRAANVLEQWLSDDAGNASGFNTAAAYRLRARVKTQSGDSAGAQADLRTAVEVAARSVRQYATTTFRASERGQLDLLFDDALLTHVKHGSPELAVGVLTLAKSVRPGSLAARSRQATEVEAALGQRLAGEVSAVAREATMALSAQRSELIQEASDQAAGVLDRFNVLTASGPGDQAVSVADVASAVIAATGAGTLVLEIFVAGEDLWLAVIGHEGVEILPVPIQLAEAVFLAQAFVEECRTRQRCRALDRLGAALLKPVEDRLTDIHRLFVVLPPELGSLPLHAVNVGGAPLIGRLDMSYLPSLGFLADGGRRWRANDRTTPTVLVASDPPYEVLEPLDFAAAEAAAILGHSGASVDNATTDLLFNRGMAAQVLHIVSHAAFEQRWPLLARLMLADRPAFAFEIATSHVASHMVNLSGCQTAAVRQHLGGESEGLSTAFLAAGSAAVIASWWPVDDDAAAQFNGAFYQELRTPGTGTPWAAACAAQRRLCGTPGFDHPSRWAPFVVAGAPEAEEQ